MELRQLRYFVETASRLSFRQAADRLYVTQPAISRQVSDLERELGVALLVRDTRHVALTPAGEILLERARRILALVDETDRALITREAKERRSMTLGVLRLAAPRITDIVRLFCDQHQDVRIEVREGDTSIYLARLAADGEVDAALGKLSDFEQHGLETALIGVYEVAALVHSGHPFATRTSLPISELAGHPILLSAGFWSTVKPYIQQAGFRANLLQEKAPSPGTALAILLRAREAVAFCMPGLAALPHGTVPVRLEPTPTMSYGLGWRRGDSSPEVEALKTLVNEVRGTLLAVEETSNIAS